METKLMWIEQRRCPRCGIQRTLRQAQNVSLCCNCKLLWRHHVPAPTLAPPPLFTEAECQRLLAYRAAVAAGFYTDQLPARQLATPSSARR
jgi:hypothetical protein